MFSAGVAFEDRGMAIPRLSRGIRDRTLLPSDPAAAATDFCVRREQLRLGRGGVGGHFTQTIQNVWGQIRGPLPLRHEPSPGRFPPQHPRQIGQDFRWKSCLQLRRILADPLPVSRTGSPQRQQQIVQILARIEELADAVSGVPVGLVARILTPSLPASGEEFTQLRSADVQQRTQHRQAADLPARRHSRQTGRTRATKQPQKDRLRLIVSLVGQDDAEKIFVGNDPAE